MIQGEHGDTFWDPSRNLWWRNDRGRWKMIERREETNKIRKLADDIDFYRSTADGSPEMLRAVGVELAVIAATLIAIGTDDDD